MNCVVTPTVLPAAFASVLTTPTSGTVTSTWADTSKLQIVRKPTESNTTIPFKRTFRSQYDAAAHRSCGDYRAISSAHPAPADDCKRARAPVGAAVTCRVDRRHDRAIDYLPACWTPWRAGTSGRSRA